MYQVKFYSKKGSMVKRVIFKDWLDAISFMDSSKCRSVARSSKAKYYELKARSK